MSLANWLLIFQTAKIGAANAGTLEPRLKLAITNVMVPWSKFVNAVEKELNHE
jgi:hypothetical protein